MKRQRSAAVVYGLLHVNVFCICICVVQLCVVFLFLILYTARRCWRAAAVALFLLRHLYHHYPGLNCAGS